MPASRARLLALCLAPLVSWACAKQDEPAAAAQEEDEKLESPAAEPDFDGELAQADQKPTPRSPAAAPSADAALAEKSESPEGEEAVEEELADEEPAAAAPGLIGGGEGSGARRPDTTATLSDDLEGDGAPADERARNDAPARDSSDDWDKGGDDAVAAAEPEPPPPPEPARKADSGRKKAKQSGARGGPEGGIDDALGAEATTSEQKQAETGSKEAPADRGIGGEAPGGGGGGGYEPKQGGKDDGRFGGQPSPLDDLPIVAGDDEPEVHTRRYGVNRTVEVGAEPILRFAASLDLASFHLCQLALAAGRLPDPGAVRVESFLAAAALSYPSPEPDEPLAVTTSTMKSQSREGFYVLRVGVTAPAAPATGAPVVFAIAVGDEEDRVKRVRAALAKTVQEAQKQGIPVAIATPGKALEPAMTVAGAKKRFRSLSIEGTLPPALERAYALAKTIGAEKIVLVSDGMPDGRVRDPASLVRTIDTHAANGVRLSVAGVGNNHYDDGLLELLSRAGRGRYEHGSVDQKASLLDIAAADAVAQDLELELVFSPEHVSRYRLVGYERRLAGRRGEIFAPGKGGLRPGESITALIEYKPKQDASGPIALVRAHYLDRGGSQREVEVDAVFDDELKPDETVALVAAGLAEKLRGAYWARTLTYDDLSQALDGLPVEVSERSSVRALAEMVSRAKALDDRPDRFAEEQPLGDMSFDALPLQ